MLGGMMWPIDNPTVCECVQFRQRPEGEYHVLYGSMFCGVCPDAASLPAECPATCEPGLTVCEWAHGCPCREPAGPERMAAFCAWLERHGVDVSVCREGTPTKG